jgi:Tfp pilus assembly protein PilF
MLLVLMVAVPVGANTRSQQLYAKALIPFAGQRWADAQVLLDQAVAADPDDAVAAYYHGLTLARLGNQAAAITELERALSVRPDLKPALLDLGILYFDTGQYPSAEQWLQRAHQQPETRFPAAFYLGMTKLRMGDAAAAVPFFEEAGKDPALRGAAQYYQALAMLRDGDTSEARTLLAQVETGPAEAETTVIAKQTLAGGPAGGAPSDGKPWSVHANAGFGYDSNVGLVPSSSAAQRGLDTDGEMDGFFRVGAGAQYRMFENADGYGDIGYNFYQSVHFSTSRFDLQSNRIDLTLATQPLYDGLVQFGIAGLYDFYLLDYASFYQAGRGTPFVNIFTGDVAATQIFYSFGGQDFLDNTFAPSRDAYINAAGIRQYFLLGAADRTMSVGYRWDDYDPLSRDGTDFAYMDNMFDVQFDFGIFDFAQGQIGYLFDLQDYEHPTSRTDYPIRRHDKQSQFVVQFSHRFADWISADIAYLGVLNDSNIADFEYDRNIIQANVWLQF